MEKIGSNVFVETGFHGCNCGLVVTNEGVVLVDTPMSPAEARGWRGTAAEYGPVRYIINTEPHGDHYSGNYYFEGTVVAHEGTRVAVLRSDLALFRQMLGRMPGGSVDLDESYYFRPASLTFSERLTLHFEGLTLELLHMPGHTPYQVAVHLPEERILFTSDNVVNGPMPFMREALPAEWMESLRRMQEMDVITFVPGHGRLSDKSFLPVMSGIVKRYVDAVQEAKAKGRSLREAQEEIDFLREFESEEPAEMLRQVQRESVARLWEVV